MGDLRRLNHWVPAAYLAAFTNDGTRDGLLTVYDRTRPGFSLTLPPHAIAKERDLYVVDDPKTGQLNDELERFLAEHVEAPFVFARNKLVYGPAVGVTPRLSGIESGEFYYFLLFQHLRTPAFRSQVQLMQKFTGSLFAHTLLSNPKEVERIAKEVGPPPAGIPDIPRMRKALEEKSILVEPDEKAWLGVAIQQIPDLLPVVESLPSAVFRAPAGIELPTSDTPIVVVKRQSSDMYKRGGGLAESDVEITFALAPSVVLVLGNALNKFDDHGSAAWFQQVRRRTATFSQRWFYAKSGELELAEALYTSEAPKLVIDYPGGQFRATDSAIDAVLDMKRKSAGGAIIKLSHDQ